MAKTSDFECFVTKTGRRTIRRRSNGERVSQKNSGLTKQQLEELCSKPSGIEIKSKKVSPKKTSPKKSSSKKTSPKKTSPKKKTAPKKTSPKKKTKPSVTFSDPLVKNYQKCIDDGCDFTNDSLACNVDSGKCVSRKTKSGALSKRYAEFNYYDALSAISKSSSEETMKRKLAGVRSTKRPSPSRKTSPKPKPKPKPKRKPAAKTKSRKNCYDASDPLVCDYEKQYCNASTGKCISRGNPRVKRGIKSGEMATLQVGDRTIWGSPEVLSELKKNLGVSSPVRVPAFPGRLPPRLTPSRARIPIPVPKPPPVSARASPVSRVRSPESSLSPVSRMSPTSPISLILGNANVSPPEEIIQEEIIDVDVAGGVSRMVTPPRKVTPPRRKTPPAKKAPPKPKTAPQKAMASPEIIAQFQQCLPLLPQ